MSSLMIWHVTPIWKIQTHTYKMEDLLHWGLSFSTRCLSAEANRSLFQNNYLGWPVLRRELVWRSRRSTRSGSSWWPGRRRSSARCRCRCRRSCPPGWRLRLACVRKGQLAHAKYHLIRLAYGTAFEATKSASSDREYPYLGKTVVKLQCYLISS